MEGHRRLDVPITEHERRLSDGDRVGPSEETRTGDSEPTIERFKSLRKSVRRVNDSDDVVSTSPVVHRRIPPDTSEQPQKTFNFAQPTSYDRQTTYSRLDYPPDLWRPFWIRKSTLGVFLLLLILIVIALVLLWHYSQARNGFNVSSSTAYYAWTYAPVAFMVVLISLWRQVDYYCKLLAPWNALRSGPTPASDTLLLDYVSPINIISFIAALKRGCLPVIFSITVFSALKVATIFSAALFLRLPTVITTNSTSAFSARAFDSSPLGLSTSSNTSNFSSAPVYSALGNVLYGLPHGTGVGTDYAYLPVNLDLAKEPILENATYTAQTEALFPNLSCTPMRVTIRGSASLLNANQSTVNSTNTYLPLQLPNGNICNRWAIPTVYAMNPQRQRTPYRQLEGTMQSVYCADSAENGSQPLEPAGLLFTVTDIRYNQTVFENGTIANSTRMVESLSNLICVPGYYVLNAEINNNSAVYGANAVDITILTVENKTIEGLSNRNLAVIYEGIMNVSQGVFGARRENPQAYSIPSTVFGLMTLEANQSSLESFLDPNMMQTAAETTFRRVMSQYASQSLTTPRQTNSTASVVYSRERLHVSGIPFWITLALFILSALCAVGLIIVAPGPLVPKDPSLIAMQATGLARSPELNRLLRKQASHNLTMASALSEHEFGTAIATTEAGQSSFKVVVSQSQERSRWSSTKIKRKWWTPNLVLVPAVSVAILLPLTLIAVLEVLRRRSNTDQGIATVKAGNNTAIYTRCIPVLVMLLVGSAVEFLDFYVELLSPWNKLASGNICARRSLMSHLLGRLPTGALVEAVGGRHFGAIFSISAAVLASIFAVFAAGLYTVQDFTTAGTSQQLVPTDAIRLQNPYSVLNDFGAAGVLNLVDHTNAPYPDGTYDDFVFLDYTQTTMQNSSIRMASQPFEATLPILRPTLQCSIVPDANVNYSLVPASSSHDTDRYFIDSTYSLPQFCQPGGSSPSSMAYFRTVFDSTGNGTTIYGGKLYDLVFGQNSSLVNHYGETNPGSVGNSPATGCPSLAFTFAEMEPSSDSLQITSLVCYQQVQQLKARVTYKANSTELDPSYEPDLLDSSISLIANPNSSTGAKSFDWRIQLNVDRQLYGNQGERLQSNNSQISFQFDAFFSYLFNNTYAESPSTLTGSSNQQALAKNVTYLYSRYMAQAINGNMRVPLSSTGNNAALSKRQSNPSAITTPTTQTRTRLVQNNTTTLTLQIFLGLASLFSILAYVLTSFHHLLPHNPSSIAGTMSLLAGSDLVWTPEDGLCDCCGKPRRSSWSHEHETQRYADSSEETVIGADPSEYQNTPNLSGGNRPARRREQIISDGAEWTDHITFAAIFAARSYSLGWWKEDRAKARRRRFGIDAGGHPDGDADDDWELGLAQGSQQSQQGAAFEDFMMRGRDMMGDQRGGYHRASMRAELSPDPGPGGWEAYERDKGKRRASSPIDRNTPLRSSPTLGAVDGFTSPRRVRFEDQVRTGYL